MRPPEFDEAVHALAEGRVVAAPTETFFGLLAVADAPAALDSLFRLKPRGPEKGVLLILPDVSEWQSWVIDIPPHADLLARTYWPGPLSIALRAAVRVDRRLTVGGSVAMRVPGWSTALELSRATGRVLTATSANAPGQPPATTAAQAYRSLGPSIDALRVVVVSGTSPGGSGSTLVAFDGSEPRVLREGPVSREQIERTLSSAASSRGP